MHFVRGCDGIRVWPRPHLQEMSLKPEDCKLKKASKSRYKLLRQPGAETLYCFLQIFNCVSGQLKKINSLFDSLLQLVFHSINVKGEKQDQTKIEEKTLFYLKICKGRLFYQKKISNLLSHGTVYNMRYIFRVLIFFWPYFPSLQARKITTKISERGKNPYCKTAITILISTKKRLVFF